MCGVKSDCHCHEEQSGNIGITDLLDEHHRFATAKNLYCYMYSPQRIGTEASLRQCKNRRDCSGVSRGGPGVRTPPQRPLN